eukprot:11190259-Alexandrium_andersonii.AAC.1
MLRCGGACARPMCDNCGSVAGAALVVALPPFCFAIVLPCRLAACFCRLSIAVSYTHLRAHETSAHL